MGALCYSDFPSTILFLRPAGRLLVTLCEWWGWEVDGGEQQLQGSCSQCGGLGSTPSFPALTSRDAGVLSACFLGSAVTNVSSLESSEAWWTSLIFAGLQSIPSPTSTPILVLTLPFALGKIFPHLEAMGSTSLPNLGPWYDLVLANQHISFEDQHANQPGPMELSYGEFFNYWGQKAFCQSPECEAGDAVASIWRNQPKG